MPGAYIEHGYQPLKIAALAELLRGKDDDSRWRLVAEFLEEYRWEPVERRTLLLEQEPGASGDERWDVFLAALSEHLAAQDGRGAPEWSLARRLRRFWFPFNSRAARVDAIVNAPAAFRSRGVLCPLTNWRLRERSALAYDARRATRDIDAVFQPHGVVVDEARAVARELGLPPWWLNEQASV